MAICKYCGQEKSLCKAHIIPRAFYIRMCEDKKHPQFSKIKLGKRKSKISPIGIYDTNILCSECDNKIGYYDNYGYNFLENIEKVSKIEKIQNNIVISVISGESYKYLELKKFFVSLIYRASISNLQDFKDISLGEKYEKEAIAFLKNNSDNLNFEVIIQKRVSDIYRNIEKMMFLPGRCRIESINFYEYVLPEYRVIIKVDQRKLPKMIDFLALRKERIIILHQRLEDSLDNDFIQEIIKENKKLP